LPIFGEKNGAFLKNQCYYHFFVIWLCFESKTPIFLLSFSAKIFFFNYNIGPRVVRFFYICTKYRNGDNITNCHNICAYTKWP
jgi:hypothetical protein